MTHDSSNPADPEASSATRERLLDVAEVLFADAGFSGASLRLITERAGANVAAVNYHFGSKEALYQQVFIRRVRPMNTERHRELDRAEAGLASGPLPLRTVLDVLLRPIVQLATSRGPAGHPFARVMSRNLIEPQPFMREILAQEMGPLIQRVGGLLRQALPHLDMPTLSFRLRFIMGATNMTFAAAPFLPGMQEFFGVRLDPQKQLEHLLLVSEAVLGAPLPDRPSASLP